MKISEVAKLLREQYLALVVFGLLLLIAGYSDAQPFSPYKGQSTSQTRDLLDLIRRRLEQRLPLYDPQGFESLRNSYQKDRLWPNQPVVDEGDLTTAFGSNINDEEDGGEEIQKRQSKTSVGSEMEATARYLRSLSQRRKDAKHMIHTIESLMHIGK